MTKEEFDKSRSELLEICIELTKSKGEDYTKGSIDVLSNFKEGEQLGITDKQTLSVYMKKHIDAIYNYIKTDGKSESEPIKMRIVDAINYLFFLNSLIEEENADKAKKR